MTTRHLNCCHKTSTESLPRCYIRPLDVTGLLEGSLAILWQYLAGRSGDSACEQYSTSRLRDALLWTGLLFITTTIARAVYRWGNRPSTSVLHLSLLICLFLYSIILICLSLTTLALEVINKVKVGQDKERVCKVTVIFTCLLLITSLAHLTSTAAKVIRIIRHSDFACKQSLTHNRQEIGSISRNIMLSTCDTTTSVINDGTMSLPSTAVFSEPSLIKSSKAGYHSDQLTLTARPASDLCYVYCYDDGPHPVFTDEWSIKGTVSQKWAHTTDVDRSPIQKSDIVGRRHQSDGPGSDNVSCRHQSDGSESDNVSCRHQSDGPGSDNVSCRHQSDCPESDNVSCRHQSDGPGADSVGCRQSYSVQLILYISCLMSVLWRIFFCSRMESS